MLLTLEIGRDEPRLFDELMDWWLLNDASISIHRLRGLADAGIEDKVVKGALAWVTHHGPRGGSAPREREQSEPAERLFRASDATHGHRDPSFAAHGIDRPLLAPSSKSTPPDLLNPIAFSLRLRKLFGVGVRAEVMRALLTINAPRMEATVIAASAGFTPRNVRETIGSLLDAGVVRAAHVGGTARYSVDRDAWAHLLQLDPAHLPNHQDWPQLLGVLRRLHRWLANPETKELSPYLLASDARALLDELTPALHYAGVPLTPQPFEAGADYWPSFESTVRELLAYLAA